jgi:hypothetical protein
LNENGQFEYELEQIDPQEENKEEIDIGQEIQEAPRLLTLGEIQKMREMYVVNYP